MLNKLLIVSFVALILTVVIFYIPNKSNFPKQIMIPIIVSLIIKYSFGDLDKGCLGNMQSVAETNVSSNDVIT